MPQVSVDVNGRTYRLTCDEGQQEHVISLAGRLEGHLSGINIARTSANEGRLILMAALMLADELNTAEDRVAGLEREAAGLRARPSGDGDSDERVAEMETAMAALLERAAEQIEDVVTELAELN